MSHFRPIAVHFPEAAGDNQRNHRTMKKTTTHILFLSIFMFLCGCGTSEYESRINSRAMSSISSGSKYAVLNAPANIPGTPAGSTVSLQLPKSMQAVDVNDPLRGKCPVLEISDLKATYEGGVKDEQDNMYQFYLYVGVSEMGGNNIMPTRGWLNKLQTDFKQNPGTNSSEVNKSYMAETPSGGTVQWEEIHFQGDQRFFYPNPKDPQHSQDMPGTFICLCHEENGIVVTLAFRYPSSLEPRHAADFDAEWLKLIAGSLKVEAPAAK